MESDDNKDISSYLAGMRSAKSVGRSGALLPPFLTEANGAPPISVLEHAFRIKRLNENGVSYTLNIRWIQDSNKIPEFDRRFNISIGDAENPDRRSFEQLISSGASYVTSECRSRRSTSTKKSRSTSRTSSKQLSLRRNRKENMIYVQAVAQVLRNGETAHEYFDNHHSRKDSLMDVVLGFLGDLDALGCTPDVFILSEKSVFPPREPVHWKHMERVTLGSFVTKGTHLHLALDFTHMLKSST